MPYIPSTFLQTSKHYRLAYHNHIEIEISSKIRITNLEDHFCLTINVPYKPLRIKQHSSDEETFPVRKHLILDIVFQRLAIPGYLITEMNVIWSHWGTLYKVEMYRIGPLPPSPSLHPFHLHYLSIDCDAQDQNISEEYNTI